MNTTLRRELMAVMGQFKRHKVFDLVPELNRGECHLVSHMWMIMDAQGTDYAAVSDVVKSLPMPAPAVSRILRGLEAKELVVRTTDPNNRRNARVAFTEKGRDVAVQAMETYHEFFDAVLDRLGEQQVKELIDGLQKLEEISREELTKRGVKVSCQQHFPGEGCHSGEQGKEKQGCEN